MSIPIRVMVEHGKKKAVASAFDWPGWDRGGKSEDDALAVLATYRPHYARVTELAGLSDFHSNRDLFDDDIFQRIDRNCLLAVGGHTPAPRSSRGRARSRVAGPPAVRTQLG